MTPVCRRRRRTVDGRFVCVADRKHPAGQRTSDGGCSLAPTCHYGLTYIHTHRRQFTQGYGDTSTDTVRMRFCTLTFQAISPISPKPEVSTTQTGMSKHRLESHYCKCLLSRLTKPNINYHFLLLTSNFRRKKLLVSLPPDVSSAV